MTNQPEPQNETATEKNDWQIAVKWLNTSGFRILIIAAGLLTVALILFVVLAIKDPNTRANVFIAGILTILTIVVTTIAAVSNRLMVEIMDRQETEMTNQRRIMQQQAKIAKKTLKRSDRNFYLAERAYLGLSNMSVDCFEANKPVAFRFKIQNGGNTPAFNVKILMQGINVPVGADGRSQNIPDVVLKILGKEKWVAAGGSHLILPGEKMNGGFKDTQGLAVETHTEWDAGRCDHWIAIQAIFTDMWGGKERSVIFLNDCAKDGVTIIKCYTSDIANAITNPAQSNENPN